MRATVFLVGSVFFTTACAEAQRPAAGSTPRARTSDTRTSDTRTSDTRTSDTRTSPSPPRYVDVERAEVPDEARAQREEVNAGNQGMSETETAITATIRKGIMGDGSLSFAARNAKVITIGTKVTLRGDVPTERERTSLGGLARATTGVTEVDNQLEVNP